MSGLRGRLSAARSHLRGRRHLVAAAAVAALGVSLVTPTAPAPTIEGVAELLGRAAGGQVAPDGFVWERGGGRAEDALLGRRVLFLASQPAPDGTAPRDVFRARVRLTRSGRPVTVRELRNLTRTPLGDEHDLAARGGHAAFATSAFGAVQGITLLDLDGDASAARGRGRLEELSGRVDRWLADGSSRGVGRIELSFASPPPSAKLELAGGQLLLALGGDDHPAAIELATGELNPGPGDPFQAEAHAVPRRLRAPARVLAAALRSLDSPRAPAAAAPAAAASPGPELAVPASAPPPEDAALAPAWPPPPVAPLTTPALPGEGSWVAAVPEGWPTSPGAGEGRPAYLFKTRLRGEAGRADADLELVAIDTRQLAMKLVAGFESPRALTGPRGAGRLPSSPLAERVVAVFAGSPDTGPADVPPGAVVARRVLSPPVAGGATLALDEDGRASLGRWPLERAAHSLLQRPVVLVEGGAVAQGDSPGGRAERAALGLTGDGHLLHGQGASTTRGALALAMQRAGCELALEIGAGTDAFAPLGFMAARRNEGEGWSLRALDGATASAAEPLPNELYALFLRDIEPGATLPEGGAWTVDPGRQPAPEWLPAIHAAEVASLGARVKVRSFAPERLRFTLRAGTREPAHRKGGTFATALGEADLPAAVASITLGAGRRKQTPGLALAGSVGHAFRGGAGALVVRADGSVDVVPSDGLIVGPGEDAAELPLTADKGELRSGARSIGRMRSRGAACVLEDGTFLVATTRFDSDEATTIVLLELGCRRVVALDRGAKAAGVVRRAGSDAALEVAHEETTLHALELPARGRARRF